MADSKDDRRSPALVLPLDRHRRKSLASAPSPMPDEDRVSADPLFDDLHRLAEDMLDEPIPDRLLDTLRKPPVKKS